MEEQKMILHDIMDQEHNRQEMAFSRMKLQAAERRINKLKARKLREAEREERFDNGEITTAERAEQRLDDIAEQEFEDGIDEIQHDCLVKRIQEVVQEQGNLLEAMSADQKADLTQDELQLLIVEYDKVVDRIELRGRNEVFKRQAELEKTLEARKARKQALLRKAANRQNAKNLWSKTKLIKGFMSTSGKAAVSGHSKLQHRMEKALDEQADAEKRSLEMTIEMENSMQLADLEQQKLTALENAGDDDERAVLIARHEQDKQALAEQLELDKQRQVRDLEQRLIEKKNRKLKLEQADLLAKESELLKDPATFAQADMVALEAESAVRREAEAARMAQALRSQDEADLHAVVEQRAASRMEISAEARGLMKEHEMRMARMEAEAAVTLGKAEDDLKARLAERRAKKEEFLAQQHALEKRALSDGADRSAVESEIEKTHQAAVAAAAVAAVAELQAEVNMLREELKEKAKQAQEAERMRHEDEVEASPQDERDALMAAAQRDAASLAAQHAIEEARQIAALEKSLLARKAKKAKKLEASHSKELSEARLEEEAKQQEAEELEALRVRMQEQKTKMLADEQRKLEGAMEALSEDVTDQERQKLINQAEKNMAKLEEYMDKEKARQEDEIRAQMEAKKKKKAERLAAQAERQKKEDELQKGQQQELEKLQASQEAERNEDMSRVQ
ncbi:hypothetical protein T484DRAFT_1813260, partial [Baffinella frigidus]